MSKNNKRNKKKMTDEQKNPTPEEIKTVHEEEAEPVVEENEA